MLKCFGRKRSQTDQREASTETENSVTPCGSCYEPRESYSSRSASSKFSDESFSEHPNQPSAVNIKQDRQNKLDKQKRILFESQTMSDEPHLVSKGTQTALDDLRRVSTGSQRMSDESRRVSTGSQTMSDTSTKTSSNIPRNMSSPDHRIPVVLSRSRSEHRNLTNRCHPKNSTEGDEDNPAKTLQRRSSKKQIKTCKHKYNRFDASKCTERGYKICNKKYCNTVQ
jgi:hypothetical protein